jgi:3-methyladenine DNA glycosylase Tag
MAKKLREIQVGENFDSELGRIKTTSHVEMKDAQYFHELVMLAFDSAFKGSVVQKHQAELSNTFSNYDFSTVAKQEFETLLAKSPIKNRKKVRGSLRNAQQFTRLVTQYGSFEKYLGSFGDVEHNTESFARMQRDMRGRFAYLGPTNFRAFMKYIRFDSLTIGMLGGLCRGWV